MNPGVIFSSSRPGVAALIAALLMAAALITLSSSTASAQAQAPNEISGRIVNATEGSDVPAGLTVRLFAVNETTASIVHRDEMIVGTNGEFSFIGFPTGEDITYRVVADNGDHTPSVDLVAGRDDFTNVEVTMWDATASFDDINIDMYSMLVPVIDRAERLMGVLAVVNISNNGDTVWVPDLDNPDLTGLDLFRFNLPVGFQELSVESNLPPGNIMEIGTGFAMTNPIPPGNYDILMSYGVAYEGSALDFPLRLPYGADQVRILLPEDSGTATGLGLGESEGIVIDDVAYSIVTGSDYPRDSQLDVKFESLPTPSMIENLQSFFDSNSYILVVIWIVAALIVALLVYALFFARKSAGRAASPAPAGGAVKDYPEYADLSRQEVISAIADLDERHDEGDISKDEYQSKREALKHMALAARNSEASHA